MLRTISATAIEVITLESLVWSQTGGPSFMAPYTQAIGNDEKPVSPA